MKILFIGLGHMGGAMAVNLVKAGHDVTGVDFSADARTAFTQAGGRAAESVGTALADVDAVITMLPSGREVRQVYLGAEGLIDKATKPLLLIDCSTVDVPTARDVAAAAAKKSHQFLDAPVSGGTAGAAAGTLTFMVGGDEAALATAKPLLEKMGQAVIHAGGAGNGQAAKICNNMVLGISMIAVAEAFGLADALGLAREKLFEIANASSGQCWSLTKYCPVPGPVPTSPANRNYQPGFTAAMMLKDLRLAQDAANGNKTATPMGALAAQVYALMVGQGNDNVDFSGVFRFLQKS